MAEAVFLSNRRTPEIVSDGAKSKKSGGKAGHVVSRRKLTAQEKKKIKGGKWLRVRKDGKKPGDRGYLSGPSKGPDSKKKTNLTDTDENHLYKLLESLAVHGHKYSADEVSRIKRHIRTQANALDAKLDLANTEGDPGTDFGVVNNPGQGQKHAQTGKTRAQPRAFGGRFGKKGATSGESAMPDAQAQNDLPPNPAMFMATANNLQVGQSVALTDNMAKVKRLVNGYQLYKMDGSYNKVVHSMKDVHKFIRKEVLNDHSKLTSKF